MCARVNETEVDTLILHGLVVTMNDEVPVIEDGAVSIKDGVIVEIGSSAELKERYRAAKVMNAMNKIIMPGLINTHTHASMSLLRGLADDVPLKEWLEKHIWPAEKKVMNAETVALGAQLAMAEMLYSGTTTFNDMYFFADQVASTAKAVGMRVVVSEGVMDIPIPFKKSPDDAVRNTEKLLAKWQGDPLVTVAVGAHSPYNCSAELLKRQKQLSAECGVPIHIHVSETMYEVQESLSKHNLTPVEYLNSLGVLGPNVIAVHCVHLTAKDIEILSEKNVGVVHNPISNAKLVSGVAPIPDLLDARVKIGLGTDGAASNSRYDLFNEMWLAALINKRFRDNRVTISAYEILKMATINGAHILGLGDKIGSLEKGKRADLIIIDANKPNLTPMYNVFSHLVYAMNSSNVETVMVDGEILMEERKLLTIDESRVLQNARSFSQQIISNES